MATDSWKFAVSANWTTAVDWSDGVPVSTSDVVVAQGNPLVTGSIGTIHSLTNSAAVTFSNAGLGSTISTFLSNSGRLIFDGNTGQGGSSLTIGGVLTNTGVVRIGAADNSLSKSDTVKASGLVNSGRLLLNGSAGAAQALLDVTSGLAGFGTTGVLTGSVGLSGNAEIEFAAGGKISKIASHSSLTLTGAHAFIADAGSLTSNSALTGLNTNFGTLDLVNGARVTTSGALTNLGTLSLDSYGGAVNSQMTVGAALTTQGSVNLDTSYGEGGSSLTITGVINNTGSLNLGNSSLSLSSTVTAAAINDTPSPGHFSSLTLSSDTTTAARMLLRVHNATNSAAAGFGTTGVLSGDASLSGDSAIVFDTGQISTIGSGAALTLDGSLAFVADAGAQHSNSALGGLTTVAGTLTLDDGASVKTGALSVSGTAYLDYSYFGGTQGGSRLTVGGVLTNSGSLYVGNADMTDGDTVTATGLVNMGGLTVAGDLLAGAKGLLNVTAAAGFGTAGVLSGGVNVSGDGAVEFASGQILSVAGTLTLDGPSAFVADAGFLGSNSALTGLTSIAGTLTLNDGANVSPGAALAITGAANLDYYNTQGGSSLKVVGMLTNSGPLNVGNSSMTKSDTVKVGSLANTGLINLAGGATASAEALLNDTGAAGFGTAGVLSGTVNVSGHGAVEFASGQITSIASGSSLTLSGPNAFIADAVSPTSNSALTGLASVAGTLTLDGGAKVTTSGGLAIAGAASLDSYSTQGGSSLTVNGLLTNTASLIVGNGLITKSDTVKAASLANTGAINLNGGATGSAEALLNDTGAAGFGTAGVLSGSVSVSGHGAVEFASGQITTIGSFSSLTLNGSNAFIADAGSLTSNSALTGLTSVAGTLNLTNGANLKPTGALAISGTTDLDYDPYGYSGYLGGSSLIVGGTALTISGNLNIGGPSLKQTDTVTVKGLANTGTINLAGGATASAKALLNDTGAAGFGTAGVLSGTVNVSGNGAVEFASGKITSIASGSSLTEDGPNAFIADAGSPTSNSALTGLSSVVGTLALDNGASVTTSGALALSGQTELDGSFGFSGGSSLIVGGALTNSGTLDVGGATKTDTVTTTGLTNSGSLYLNGEAKISGPITNSSFVSVSSSKNDISGAVTGNGSMDLNGGSSLEFDSSVGSGQNVYFFGSSSSASLLLGSSAATTFAGTMNDFSLGDSFDLVGFGTGTSAGFVENGSNTGGVLTVTNGAHVGKFAFAGSYTTSNFTLTSTASDTLITYHA